MCFAVHHPITLADDRLFRWPGPDGFCRHPSGPKKSASSWWATKVAVARSNSRLRFIFLLKLKSKLSSVPCGSRNCACFRRRSSTRSPPRVSSSDTRQERKSIGAIGSACACCRRVSSTAAMPPRCSFRKARFSSIDSFWLLPDFEIDEIAIDGKFADQGIVLPQKHLRMRVALQSKRPNPTVCTPSV